MKYQRASTTLKIAKLREKKFMSILEYLSEKHRDWGIAAHPIESGWFTKIWEISTNSPNMLTNVINMLDNRLHS